jgi:hypothetical protein
MQDEAVSQAVLPNRRERRRVAASTKRLARSACACCRPAQNDERPADAAEAPSLGRLNPA